MAQENILEVKNLSTYFFVPEGEVKAVDNVSFSLKEGEIIGLVGESGCGKSVTSLSILQLIDSPGKIVAGEVLYRGMDLLSLSEHKMRNIRGNKISIIFQDPMTSLNPLFPVGYQIIETILAHEEVSKNEAYKRAVSLLNDTGITDAEKRFGDYPHQFSGGMRQRVMIAIALACNPDIIIADEATTALDVTIQAQILDVFRSLVRKRKTSVIFITHDLGIIAELCEKVVVMYAGKVFEYGKTIDIFEDPKHPYTIGLLSSLPEGKQRGEKLNNIRGVVPIPIDLPFECRFRERCDDFNEEYCKEEEPNLIKVKEDHYVACHKFSIEEFEKIR